MCSVRALAAGGYSLPVPPPSHTSNLMPRTGVMRGMGTLPQAALDFALLPQGRHNRDRVDRLSWSNGTVKLRRPCLPWFRLVRFPLQCGPMVYLGLGPM